MTLIKIKNKQTEALINSLGAELVSFSKSGQNAIWEVDKKYWNKTSPVLFPIVGQLKNETFKHNGNIYSLNRHGFARDREFEIVSKKENEVVFLLKETEESVKKYPFYFALQITYTLIENKLEISFEVTNSGKETMYFSIGAHPAFGLKKPIENYSLQFNLQDDIEVTQLENGLLTTNKTILQLKNKELPLSNLLFQNDALVIENCKSKRIVLLENEVPKLALSFQDFTDLGIWTKPYASFICIEPWLGHTDSIDTTGDFNLKKGIIALKSCNVFTCCYSIELF